MEQPVTFNLAGNFHRDIRGAKIHFTHDGQDDGHAQEYMRSFALEQTGLAGDMTVGDPPGDYVKHPYFEWYSDQNGRVVIELNRDQVQVIGRPIPACESDPISREEQHQHMAKFLQDLGQAMLGGPDQDP